MRLNYKLITSMLLVLPSTLAAINGKCSSGNGVCVTTDSCTKAKGTYVNNKCPNDPKNVKCCNKKCKYNGISGECKFSSNCKGKRVTGLCPGGKDFICCIPEKKTTSKKVVTSKSKKVTTKSKKVTTKNTKVTKVKKCPTTKNKNDTKSGKSREDETLPKILNYEGGCQNDSKDSGNKIDGKIGYTCAGLTPSKGWEYRSYFSYATSKCTNKVKFTKCAYDLNKTKYKNAVKKIYVDKYAKAGGCNNLPQPAYYVCFDCSVNFGPGMPSKYIKNNPIGNKTGKEYGLWLNNKSREEYKRIAKNNPSKQKFLKGWLNRAQSRENYCKSYC